MTNATTQSDIDAETLRSATMTPRSLVGMTMGARKRHALSAQEDDALSRLMRDPLKVLSGHFDAHDNAEQYRKPYRIGQRLRPCPGCAKCHPATRRFAPTAGWKSPRKWILWDGAKLWMIARTWRRLCTVPTLADYTSGVDDGTWKELFCDSSGVLPAKGKVRR